MTIRVYNTLTKTKELFEPIQEGQVGIYLCGPTVYKPSHIGHMVGPVIFDTIKRYLVYNDYKVTWVVNITDVDDKLIAESQRRGISMPEVAEEMTADYLENLAALNVREIDAMPKATDHIAEIVAFIEGLIEKGFAYAVDGDVFFEVSRNAEYGKLSNRSADSQLGAGGEASGKKRTPGDFALWKAAKADDPSWDSPWGPGRPGWHIECSAMSHKLLGTTFDIHGGGLDLVFPHHAAAAQVVPCRLQQRPPTGPAAGHRWMLQLREPLPYVVEQVRLLGWGWLRCVRAVAGFIRGAHQGAAMERQHEQNPAV